MARIELDPLFDQSPKARLKRWLHRVINTRYLLIAVILHLVGIFLFGGHVVFEALDLKGIFENEGEVLVAIPQTAPPPPPTVVEQEKKMEVKVAPDPTKVVARIASSKLTADFNVPPPDIPMVVADSLEVQSDQNVRDLLQKTEINRLQGVRQFHEQGVTGEHGKPGASGKGRQTVAKFTCYVAQYSGGDWDCNFGALADDRWYGNCLFNLMTQIDRWSQGRVKANLLPEALKLSSRDWIDKVKPPFIFITGHRDFYFTEAEAKNLREYLMLGGALWIDNAYPGRRSLFDIAIRREMKKILPDRDFEPINNSHPVFNNYFNFPAPPAGMNFYKEPVEVIKIGGEVSVFYTLNAYSDLWEAALTPKDEIDLGMDWSPSQQMNYPRWGPHFNYYAPTQNGNVYTTGSSYSTGIQNQYEFFRNVNRQSVVSAYQFGINIVIFLLTRYQDSFLTLPQGGT